MRINLNELDQRIAKLEGKRVELPIAQIKEARRCVLTCLARYSEEDVLELLHKYRNAPRVG